MPFEVVDQLELELDGYYGDVTPPSMPLIPLVPDRGAGSYSKAYSNAYDGGFDL